MAITIEEDQIDGMQVSEDKNGLMIVRKYLVSGLTNSSRLLLDARVAIDTANNKKIPVYGEPDKDEPRVFASRVEPKPFKDSRTQANVYVTFRPPELDFGSVDSPVIKFHGTSRSVRSNVDADFKKIDVDYTAKLADDSTAALPTQVGAIDGTKALGVLTFDYIVNNDPENDLVPYLNRINSRTWRGFNKYFWHCAELEIEKVLYRSGWHVYIAFVLDEDMHTHISFYRLRNGYIPKDVPAFIDKSSLGQGNGYTVSRSNPLADFNQLNLPIAT